MWAAGLWLHPAQQAERSSSELTALFAGHLGHYAQTRASRYGNMGDPGGGVPAGLELDMMRRHDDN